MQDRGRETQKGGQGLGKGTTVKKIGMCEGEKDRKVNGGGGSPAKTFGIARENA